MKLTLYVLTDGPEPSLHRRLLHAEMKADDRGMEMVEFHHHQGFINEVVNALRMNLEAITGIPREMVSEEKPTGVMPWCHRCRSYHSMMWPCVTAGQGEGDSAA